MKYLTLEEVLILHEYQIDEFGGSHGIRDVRLLESAIQRPQTTFDGNDLYVDIYEKAAALVFSLIKNHPFVDGNKRAGIHACLTFLELNGIKTNFAKDSLVRFGIDIASDQITTLEIIKFLS